MEVNTVNEQFIQAKNKKNNNIDGMKQFVTNTVTVVLFLIVWTILANLVGSTYFPNPIGVFQAFIDLMINGDLEGYTLFAHMNASIIRVLTGFGVAVISGIALGLLMGLYPSLYEGSRAIIEPIRFIPPIAWVPMAIVLLSGFSRYVFLIWLGAFFPLFINILVSVPKVDSTLKDVVKVYGGKKGSIVRKVVIPSVLPDILSGMRVGLGAAWMCIVAAEMIGGESIGLGRLILKYADLLRSNEIIVGMLLIGLIGFLSNEALLRIEKHLFRWRSNLTL